MLDDLLLHWYPLLLNEERIVYNNKFIILSACLVAGGWTTVLQQALDSGVMAVNGGT